jgi:hypothetical protein
MAAAQTTAFENGAAVRSRHALAKSMNAHTAADLRLVRTFGHSSFLTLKIIAYDRAKPEGLALQSRMYFKHIFPQIPGPTFRKDP